MPRCSHDTYIGIKESVQVSPAFSVATVLLMVAPLSHGFQKILLTALAELLPNIELTWIIDILLSEDEYFPWNMTLH